MKKKLLLLTIVTGLLVSMSFTLTDFQKTIIGKWELKTIQQPGKAAMPTKDILGESFMEFKSDFTYVETGESNSTGTWKITEAVFLQTKETGKESFTEKMELKELSPDKIQLTSSSSKTSLVDERIKK